MIRSFSHDFHANSHILVHTGYSYCYPTLHNLKTPHVTQLLTSIMWYFLFFYKLSMTLKKIMYSSIFISILPEINCTVSSDF